jgi:hypothetical protein
MMMADAEAPDAREVSSSGRRRRRRSEGTPGRLLARRVAGFLAALGLTVLLALDGGGYDIVIRQEVGLVVWALIALGLAVGVLPRARLTPAAWTALAGFGALTALTLLSQTWTASGERSTQELARVLQYGGLVVLAYLTLNRYTWRGAAMGFAAGALVIPCFSVGARLFPDTLTDEIAVLGTDRLSYPLDYWNGVACWGAMAVAVGLALSANSSRAAIRAAALTAVPVAALSVYLTYSRFGVAAVAIAVLAAIAVSRNRWTAAANAVVAAAGAGVAILVARDQGEIARATGDAGAGEVLLALLGVAAACALVAALTFRAGLDRIRMSSASARLALAGAGVAALLLAVAVQGPLGEAWDEFKEDRPPPATGGTERLTTLGGTRYDVWSAAIDAFQSDPWRGIGPGTFEFYWSRNGEGGEFLRDGHSLYIEQAAELGIPGLIATVVGLAGLLAAAIQARLRWRRRREIAAGSAMIAAFVVFLAYAGVDWMWELGAIGTLAIGGVAVAGAGGLERAGDRQPGAWMRLGLTMGALLIAAAQVPGLVSTQRIRESEKDLEGGRLAAALDAAEKAVDAEPWAASPYAMRALVLERSGDLAGATEDANEAIDRAPDDWRNHLLLARLEAERGRRSAALRELAESRRLAPRNPLLLPVSPEVRPIQELIGGGPGG